MTQVSLLKAPEAATGEMIVDMAQESGPVHAKACRALCKVLLGVEDLGAIAGGPRTGAGCYKRRVHWGMKEGMHGWVWLHGICCMLLHLHACKREEALSPQNVWHVDATSAGGWGGGGHVQYSIPAAAMLCAVGRYVSMSSGGHLLL